MHELTKLLYDNDYGLCDKETVKTDQIITDYLREKSNEIFHHFKVNHSRKNIEIILGLREKTLEEKIKDFCKTRRRLDILEIDAKDLAKIASEHYKDKE